MKKIGLMIALFVGMAFVNAQQGTNWLKLGVHAGIPVGDAGDYSSFMAGIDAKYQFLDFNSFGIGAATGYSHYFGKEMNVAGMTIDAEDFGFIPLAVLLRYYPTQSFFIGTDLGYAIGVSDNFEGGFYFRPEIGWHNEDWNVFGFYQGVSDSPMNIGAVGIGVNYNIISRAR
ncbi:MAG: hypothetical protein Q4F57_02075 [Weeksellaceae bacterium]|nr:hypothetical protein [Weeksellaceae bacterium]